MELPVARQAVEFAWAAALGLALGCWYDVLRALRRRHRRLTVPADGLYCLTALLALLAFALYAGRGMMRLFALLGMGLGAMLWFLTLSPLALRLFSAFWALLGKLLRLICAPVRGILKIFLIFFKKVFATARKWPHGKGGPEDMKLIKSSLLVKLVILILVVYATVTLVKLQSRISDKKAEADALTSSITTAEQENGRLQDAIDKLDTPEGVENVARDKLDMAAEGEIIFYDVSD